ncbi:MAG: HAMP domain-containing protein, partial [Proteobacteria bacterium]|nr:HAMP domain-containing protein [Pseudomonadota bacterium]
RVYRKLFNPPVPVADEHFYDSKSQFTGTEVKAALEGRYGAITRLSYGGQRSVTLFTAIPVVSGDIVVGAVLCSQSTYRIMKDLYELRLFILRIFLTSLIAAVLISLFLSFTISRRIKRLSREAGSITTGRGRIRGSFTPLRLKDEIGLLSHSLKDLTDRLDRHIQFIDSFSRDISHEFKNPLAVVRSASEMICRSEGDQQKRFVQLIDQNTKRMESLLNGIEEISRLDSHLDQEKKESVDLCHLLETLIEGFKLQYPHHNWNLEKTEKPLQIFGSPERLSQVFVNIYENGASFSKENGEIRTSFSLFKDSFNIIISNEGP